MSKKSNDNGRAFEFAFINTLRVRASKYRSVNIIENEHLEAAKNAWNNTSDELKKALVKSAEAATGELFDIEPLIIEDGSDVLELFIQADAEGKIGDVRDIVIIRRNIKWEIGISCKHNHFAVKHSRLAKNLDFGEKWYGIPCSEQYWKDIKPIFDSLEEAKSQNLTWKALPDKEKDVYIPLLNAFISEIKRCNAWHKNTPRKLVEYLLGKYDFYKVISIDNKQMAQIQTFNLRGTLNKPSKGTKPLRMIEVVPLPTRIVSLELKPKSGTTAELYMDNGWQFSFRIHNAKKSIETSLKFDIQIIGMPVTIMTINCIWK